MYQNLNTVKPKVRLNGEVIEFDSLSLRQDLNSCQRFEVVVSYMTQADLWKSAEHYRAQMGMAVLIRFEHLDGSGEYEFSGVTTDVTVEALDGGDGVPNRVRIIGAGDSVALDGTVGRASYTDSTLSKVVLGETSGAGVAVECEPAHKGILPYLMRYDESAFGFLNRLSALYGEWFYYDGRKLHFGEPTDHHVQPLLFDAELLSLRSTARAVPSEPSCYDYFVEEDKFESRMSKPLTPSVDDLVRRSDYVYRGDGATAVGAALPYSGSLADWAERRQLGARSRMLNIEGETNTCRLRLGGVVEVSFPRSMGVSSLGRYRIVSLHHRVDRSGNYRNRFEAVPEGFGFALPGKHPSVKAHPEVAVVSDNADPSGLGRVKVQFYWQMPIWESTNWLRVVTPNAGGSDAVPTNRGFLFVPEVGDHVMVGFEHGDPNRPYVIGGLFSGGNGRGGGEANAVKSICTRSGHRIEFNDDEGGECGISISDKSGNIIQWDTNGKSISIFAQNSISLTSNNISIDASELLTLNAGGGMVLHTSDTLKMVSNNGTDLSSKSVSVNASERTQLSAESLQMKAETNISMNSKKINIDSTEDNLVLATGGSVDVQSKDKVKLF